MHDNELKFASLIITHRDEKLRKDVIGRAYKNKGKWEMVICT